MAAGFRRAKNMLILRRNALLNNLARNTPRNQMEQSEKCSAVME
ncbi:hypothetical protein SF2A_25245 (plasmid) [Shigella flexneri G1663]|uniref:Uncharacterized protein n=1 Tax=Shigella dysenteriae WRSd3 TaxID=1401327 RepID=A0A090N9K8_SHIDY|nr:hypothetical protein SF2A_25245 [Shigella flexneri G1663]EFW50868.1 hypothetical protein SDB_01720 [Shigella dysenteriae CDC 74-1112]EIQ30501.1 hypothetical protein SFK404_1476 [Shigella flexneri K-404]ESU76160.1 hypothetical protein WRSd3_p00312 [Shigella dysenteriae WRSd3]ESU78170.1 hypothetical protein WRSd3_03066 [Shigella dysenteriae WRSd3]